MMASSMGVTMGHVTLLLFALGVIVVSLHGVKAQQRHNDCLPNRDGTFPKVVRVRLNIKKRPHSLGKDFSNRSLSPWDYSKDVDDHRFPSMIHEAKCRHTQCLDARGNLDPSINSVPIRQEILVLRKMKGCNSTFRLEKKMVTVGCTCVWPIVHHLQKDLLPPASSLD
ncbi:interleukin-17F-like [Xenopus laevis]|uniref:Interleukin-17F-like n=1 Tax=Xenopus laevis TaxID=8355 RepID=A0A8J1KLX2_XENLA|nr:interleukin-17F-like [Xenopus laevis]